MATLPAQRQPGTTETLSTLLYHPYVAEAHEGIRQIVGESSMREQAGILEPPVTAVEALIG
jgi:hypothetical protein